MATTASKPATEADLWAMPDDEYRYELVDGEIRPMSPTGRPHGRVAARLMVRLGGLVEAQQLGESYDSSTGFRMPNGNVRSPDLAFIATSRLEGVAADGYLPVVPDLAVEVLSPGDRSREVFDKVGEYLDAGVQLVWVIDPVKRCASRYRSLTDLRTLGIDDFLDGEDVVPGFRCALSEIL